jgi:peptidoglycan/xylan/chitin deacetylase (PgdA/CDA1 family)
MYHHIGASFKSPYNVSTSDFEAQMGHLAQNGYTTVSIDQIAAALRGESRLPPCPVAITFDDGYASQYANALPILREHGFRASFNLVLRYVGMSKAFIGWEQVEALAAADMSIGSHTYDHAELTTLSDAQLDRQVVRSKNELEDRLGVSISTFVYPYGSYNARVMRAVEEAGYTAAFGIGWGYQQSTDRVFRLNRIAIYELSLPQFIARLPKHGPYGDGTCPPSHAGPSQPERDSRRFTRTISQW